MERSYHILKTHYETCLREHGDSPKGMDWPNARDADLRYKVFVDCIRQTKEAFPNLRASENLSLLDFACGTGRFVEVLQTMKLYNQVAYSGVDINPSAIAVATGKYPNLSFRALDILDDSSSINGLIFDIAIVNGLFTEKREMTYREMFDFLEAILVKIKSITKYSIAFNVMSDHVEWSRLDLFHASLDSISSLVSRIISNNFIIRHDYGLREFTVLAFKDLNETHRKG